jgi:DeoR family transcriptional regulator of aga operon
MPLCDDTRLAPDCFAPRTGVPCLFLKESTIHCSKRENSTVRLKSRRIGLAGAELIQEHETVGFTAGTTTTHVARNIRSRHNIRVVTNAVNIAMELCNCAGLQTLVTAGLVQWAGSFSLVGHGAINFLKDIYIDKLFISVCGIDAKRGVTVIESEEALTFRAMIQQAKKTIVVADSSKLGLVNPARICAISDVQLLITDSHASKSALAPFVGKGIEVRKV